MLTSIQLLTFNNCYNSKNGYKMSQQIHLNNSHIQWNYKNNNNKIKKLSKWNNESLLTISILIGNSRIIVNE